MEMAIKRSVKPKQSFTKFIEYSIFQKEVCLVIVKTKEELKRLQRNLQRSKFKKAKTPLELLEKVESQVKTYFVVESNLDKQLYDLILQYPTGQIELFDQENMQSRVVVPDYKDSSVILLITKGALRKAQKKGFNVLAIVGLTYQA